MKKRALAFFIAAIMTASMAQGVFAEEPVDDAAVESVHVSAESTTDDSEDVNDANVIAVSDVSDNESDTEEDKEESSESVEQAYESAEDGDVSEEENEAADEIVLPVPSEFSCEITKAGIRIKNTASYPDVDGYIIYRSENGGSYKRLITKKGTILDYTDSAVTEGAIYRYRLKTYKTIDSEIFYSDYTAQKRLEYISYHELVLVTPGTPLCEVTQTGYIVKSQESFDNIEGYVIYRSENGGSYKKIASVKGKSLEYSDENAVNGTVYRYRIKTYGREDGVVKYSDYSAQRKVIFLECPKGVTASNKSTYIAVSWKAVSGAESYDVYRSVDGAAYAKVGSGVKTLSYSDTTAKAEKTYAYKVVAKASGALSGYSDAFELPRIERPVVNSIKLVPTGIELNFTKPAGASMCYIYRSTDGGATYENVAKVKTDNYVDNTVKDGVSYSYRLNARRDVDGVKYYSACTSWQKITAKLDNTITVDIASDIIVSLSKPAPSNVNFVQFAVWSESNGQDDIEWYNAVKQSDGRFRVKINASKILSSGKCYIDCYGDYKFLNSSSFELSKGYYNRSRGIKTGDIKSGTVISDADISKNGKDHYFEKYEVLKGDDIYNRINGYSYHEGGNTNYSDLAYVRVLYYDFDGIVRSGELMVNKAIAVDVIGVFKALYEMKYPIEKMRLVDDYGASDDASIIDHNTSAFNDRNIAGTAVVSNHAYGFSIDINPWNNPLVYDSTGREEPSNPDYLNDPHFILNEQARGVDVVAVFEKYGFTWLVGENGYKDYQHFQKIVR